MTFREKQQAMLDDLIAERNEYFANSAWLYRLDEKIAGLQAAMGLDNSANRG